MRENSLQSSIIESFAKVTKELWKRAASHEIEGRDPFNLLSWKSDDEINFFPYYDLNDVATLNYLENFQLTVGTNSFLGPREWLSLPFVSVSDVEKANKIALDHLANGAEGVFFRFNGLSDVSIHQLLHHIEWAYCTLCFHSERNSSLSEELRKYISNHVSPEPISGTIFWESCPKRSDVDFFLKSTAKFKPLGLKIKSSSASLEVAEALSVGVDVIETFKDSGTPLQRIFDSIAFSISIDPAFLINIAKLKSLRLLWYQVSQAYKLKNFNPGHLHVHADVHVFVNEKYQPNGTMLNNTTAAMAAIMGGCNALTIHPEQENNPIMDRVARNVSAILREESYLNKVADPLAGSYSIDTMVNEISKKAWSIFQSNLEK